MDRPGTCIILDKKYNIANSYGSIWTDPSPKKYYMDFRSFGPYNIFLVTDGPYTAMNYLLYICLCKNMAKGTEKSSPCMLSRHVVHLGILKWTRMRESSPSILKLDKSLSHLRIDGWKCLKTKLVKQRKQPNGTVQSVKLMFIFMHP